MRRTWKEERHAKPRVEITTRNWGNVRLERIFPYRGLPFVRPKSEWPWWQGRLVDNPCWRWHDVMQPVRLLQGTRTEIGFRLDSWSPHQITPATRGCWALFKKYCHIQISRRHCLATGRKGLDAYIAWHVCIGLPKKQFLKFFLLMLATEDCRGFSFHFLYLNSGVSGFGF